MLDEYLALGGVELGNNARALAYSQCLSCCAGLLKGGVCDGIHDATNAFTNAVWEWQEQAVNVVRDPRGANPTTQWATDGATAASMPGGGVEYTIIDATVRLGPRASLAISTEYTVTLVFESSVTRSFPVHYRVTQSSSSGGVSLGNVNLVAGEPLEQIFTFTTTATPPTATSGFYIVATNGNVGATVRISHPIAVAGAEPVLYFDGSTIPEGADAAANRTSWTGTPDASPSLWERDTLITQASSDEPTYDCSVIDRAPWYDPDNPFSQEFAGFYLLAVRGITDGTMTAGVTEGIEDGGVIGAARHSTRSVRVRTMLVGCGNAAAEYGLAWLKAALGETFCARHGDACGTSDLEFFIDCPPPLDSGDSDYAAATSPYRRYLHGVSCTSAPIIAEEYETPSGAYVIIVEYILTAESPFVWGETVPVEATGTILTAFDDIPFNLMRRPSGEQGDGIPAVVATQYAFNGSAEYGGSAAALPTGWARAVTNIAAGVTDAKSSDIAAVGPNSARVRLLATGTVTDGTIRLYYDVALGSLPAGSRPSIAMWAAVLTFAGAPTVGSFHAEVEWRTAVATVSTTPLGPLAPNGDNVSAPGLVVPATATIARLAVVASDIDAVAGDDLRLYADAFGLTVP